MVLIPASACYSGIVITSYSIHYTKLYESELFKNDELSTKPDSAIKSRLDYTFLLKESQSKIRQNSFTGLFTWFFSIKNLPVKAALFSVVMLFSVFRNNFV